MRKTYALDRVSATGTRAAVDHAGPSVVAQLTKGRTTFAALTSGFAVAAANEH
jgi:hypothetical protein